MERPETISLLVRLIREQLDLDERHVVAYNQRIPLSPDDGLFVAIGIAGYKPYGSKTAYEVSADGTTLNEVQVSQRQEIYSIQIFSADNSARARNQEVLFAIASTAAEQIQERFGFLIGRIPVSFVDLSAVEGARRLNRYVLTVNVLTSYGRTRPVQYFDQFAGQPALIAQP